MGRKWAFWYELCGNEIDWVWDSPMPLEMGWKNMKKAARKAKKGERKAIPWKLCLVNYMSDKVPIWLWGSRPIKITVFSFEIFSTSSINDNQAWVLRVGDVGKRWFIAKCEIILTLRFWWEVATAFLHAFFFTHLLLFQSSTVLYIYLALGFILTSNYFTWVILLISISTSPLFSLKHCLVQLSPQ